MRVLRRCRELGKASGRMVGRLVRDVELEAEDKRGISLLIAACEIVTSVMSRNYHYGAARRVVLGEEVSEMR